MTDPAALSARYVELTIAGEGPRAVEEVLGALVDGELDLGDFYDEVLGPAARRIGELWYGGRISVADEHHATELTRRVIEAARRVFRPGAPSREPVVLACPPEELHDMGLRMAAHVLEHAGHEVVLLGARTPARDLVELVGRREARIVGLSCSTPLSLPDLLLAVDALRAGVPGVRVVLGGACVDRYPAVGDATGADAVCVRLGQLAGRVEELAP